MDETLERQPGTRPCDECGEETYNPKLCRDCDLQRMFTEWPTCKACGVKLFSDFVRGSGIPEGHADGCPAADRDAIARDYRVAEYDSLSKMRNELRQKSFEVQTYARELLKLLAEVDACLEHGRPFQDGAARRALSAPATPAPAEGE